MTREPAPDTSRLYAEDETGATVVLATMRHRNYGRRFLTMFQETTAQISGMDRPPVYFRALLHLLTRLDPVQPRRLSARELAQGANLSQASAERALAMLEADRVIFCSWQTGAKARRLNNNLCWMSNSEKWASTPKDPEVIDARGR